MALLLRTAYAFRVTWSEKSFEGVRLGYVAEMQWPRRPGKTPYRENREEMQLVERLSQNIPLGHSLTLVSETQSKKLSNLFPFLPGTRSNIEHESWVF